ncbi:MAG: sugar/nucleoside kinase (ribokinase family) [Candidatus Azotimanducaceae bacterium]|jgi:sugar/nucleoside kinase (ribokinase family)
MEFSESKSIDVVGLGNALMDFLVEVDEEVLAKTELAKGSMQLVDEKKAKELLKSLTNTKFLTTPGGAAANTIKAVAALGGDTVLFAKVGEDEHGSAYIEAIELHGVTSRITKHTSTTGHALTFITPDAQRTFSVHLGAALTLGKEDILEEDIANAKILHLEAFQFEGPTQETVLHAIEVAKKHNTLISVDLADSLLIERNLDLFKEVVKRDIDILFCNEDEGKAFTGKEGKEALEIMAGMADTAILKLGEKGSLISIDGEVIEIEAFKTVAVDTTGAGDTYAAGFLYGLTHGWNTEKSGNLGSLLASKVIAKVGVDILDIDIKAIYTEIGQ